MKRFRFGLERVLEWRRGQAEVEEARLAKFFAERKAIEDRRAQVEKARREADAALLGAADAGAAELTALEDWRRHSRLANQNLSRGLAECDARIGEQRRRVMEAWRRHKLLERLKERRLSEWLIETDREIENLSSELYLAKWQRTGPRLSAQTGSPEKPSTPGRCG